MFRALRAKLKALWVIFRSTSAHIVYQRHLGTEPHTIGYGHGDLRDLVLFAKEIKNMHDGFTQMINEVASQTGDLHALQQLREAVDVITKEQ